MLNHPRNRKQKARAGLSLALSKLHDAESRAKEHAQALATAKKDLRHHREVVRLATQDARHAGVL